MEGVGTGGRAFLVVSCYILSIIILQCIVLCIGVRQNLELRPKNVPEGVQVGELKARSQSLVPAVAVSPCSGKIDSPNLMIHYFCNIHNPVINYNK